MKSVLIVGSDMEIGGAERALLGLLEAIDTERYDVDLFLMRHQGPFMKLIPEKINVLPESSMYSNLGIPIVNTIKKGHFLLAGSRIFGKLKAKQYIKKHGMEDPNSVEIHYSFLYTKWLLPKITDKKYDLVCSFTVPYYIATEKIHAKKSIGWLHTDYSCIAGNTEKELDMWSAFDYIASISDNVTEGFLAKFPTLKTKIIQIENIISPPIIKKQADEFAVEQEMPEEEGIIRLLSVGRFCKAKNFDNIPEICAKIVDLGGKIKWYIIGFGGDEELIRTKIQEHNMSNHIVILGKKENPYPYIKACDIYVQPSRFEGKAVTVREAQILNKPVIITDYPTASSQLMNGMDGVIVPMDISACAKGIYDVVLNMGIQQNLILSTKKMNYANKSEIKKIYDVLDKI